MNQVGCHLLVPWSSPRQWYRRHSVLHHQFTNTALDTDIQTGSALRHHLSVKWDPFMRLQVLSVTAYSLVVAFLYQFSKVTALQAGLLVAHWYAKLTTRKKT